MRRFQKMLNAKINIKSTFRQAPVCSWSTSNKKNSTNSYMCSAEISTSSKRLPNTHWFPKFVYFFGASTGAYWVGEGAYNPPHIRPVSWNLFHQQGLWKWRPIPNPDFFNACCRRPVWHVNSAKQASQKKIGTLPICYPTSKVLRLPHRPMDSQFCCVEEFIEGKYRHSTIIMASWIALWKMNTLSCKRSPISPTATWVACCCWWTCKALCKGIATCCPGLPTKKRVGEKISWFKDKPANQFLPFFFCMRRFFLDINW